MVCPSAQQLRQFLGDELSGDVYSALVAHVSECVECQRGLDALTNDPAPITATPTATESGLLDLMDRLRERPFAAWSVVTEPVGSLSCHRFAGPISEAAPLGCLGPYQIEAELGAGGTGQVFAARDSRLGRRVAIKVLRPQWAGHAEARSRFEREARAVAALEDEQIVKVFEVGTTPDGSPFLVMEFIDGESLEARLRRERTIAPREAAAIARQIALGLSGAHRRGIVHRDVKPGNVLLQRIESGTSRLDSQLASFRPQPVIKLADFGLARVAEATEQLTQEGFIAGTPAYMSPEQIRRPQEADARSDVYSAAVLLYEMLTGERPFRGVVRMVLSQALHEEPVPPRRLNDRVPRDLETICLKGMSKEPSLRYATAAELADDLNRWLDGRPVLARPVGAIGRVWRWSRRNPKLAAINAVVVLVLLAGSADVARYARPAEHRSRDVETARHESERLRMDVEQLRNELTHLAQAVVFQDSDDRPALEAALRSLDSLRGLDREDDVRPAIAVAHSRLGDWLSQNGQPSQAMSHLKIALTLLRDLITEQPLRRDWKIAVTSLLVRQVEASRQLSRGVETERLVAESLREFDELERDAVDLAEIGELAHARLRLAESLSRLERTDEARRQLRSACESLGRIASRPMTNSRQLREALAAVGRLANELLEHHEFTEAFAILDPAANWAERLLDTADVTFADQQAAVLLLRNLALVEHRLDRRTEAARRFEQLGQTLSRLETDDQTSPQVGRKEWITSQRRELSELQSAVAK